MYLFIIKIVIVVVKGIDFLGFTIIISYFIVFIKDFIYFMSIIIIILN